MIISKGQLNMEFKPLTKRKKKKKTIKITRNKEFNNYGYQCDDLQSLTWDVVKVMSLSDSPMTPSPCICYWFSRFSCMNSLHGIVSTEFMMIYDLF